MCGINSSSCDVSSADSGAAATIQHLTEDRSYFRVDGCFRGIVSASDSDSKDKDDGSPYKTGQLAKELSCTASLQSPPTESEL